MAAEARRETRLGAEGDEEGDGRRGTLTYMYKVRLLRILSQSILSENIVSDKMDCDTGCDITQYILSCKVNSQR